MASAQPSRFCSWALLAVCLVYLAQLWTPLRLTGDSIELLSIAASAADGDGFLNHGQKSHYFPGYPAMVVCLERLGAARSWGFVGLNALFLVLAFVSANYLARHYFHLSSSWAVITLLATTLSFALVKHFPLPLTDIPFFGVSMAAVAVLVKAEKQSGVRFSVLWALACLVSFFAVLVRPIAIALFPCLLWALAAHLGFGAGLRLNKRTILAGCCLATIVAGLAAKLLLNTKYVQEALPILAHRGLGHGIRTVLLLRVHEFGELTLNAPASKLGVFSPLAWFFGVAAISMLVMCMWRCKLGLVEVYLAAYSLITLVWPYGDPRFWTPVLPLLVAEFFSVTRPWTITGWKRRAGILYAAMYALMGLLALAYSTRITFSGTAFPYCFGDEHLRATYAQFYANDRAPGPSKIDQLALELLQRYSAKGKH